MASLLAAAESEPELVPLEAGEPGLESEPVVGKRVARKGHLHWLQLLRGKRAAAGAMAGAAVLLLAASALLLSSPRLVLRSPRAARIGSESVELAESSEALPKAFGVQGLDESNVAEKVFAAKDRWTRQFWRSMGAKYNEANEEPRVREQTHKWDEPGNPWRKFETLNLFVFVDPSADCTVAFGGDQSWSECTGPLETTDVPECGLMGVYKCYLRQTMTLLQDDQWKKAAEILTSPECKGGVQATGWGEGGTQAGIFAACANNAKNGTIVLNGTEVKLPTVTSLLTFGARPVGEGEQPTNGQSPDGVFQGVRIWYEHDAYGPNVAEVDGCAWGWRGVSKPVAVHPKMWAMSARLTWAVSYEAALYKPTSEAAMKGNTTYQRIGSCGAALSSSYYELKEISTARMGN